MDSMPGAADAAERLRRTALRDFGAAAEWTEQPSRRIEIPSAEAPLPTLMKCALELIGLPAGGPGEKVAWWVNFTYKGYRCELAHQKFGLRLYLRSGLGDEQADALLAKIVKKLLAAVRTVEKVILDSAPETLARGDATVRNQYRALLRAYEYFRDRALNPTFIADERTDHEPPDGSAIGTVVYSFSSGAIKMKLNAFHDLVAALTAYLSLLEHRLVLSLAFSDFDPASDNLTEIIGSRWGDKWIRMFGKADAANLHRQRLVEVIERWRNPYSHGGFEKGHGATIYLHTPGAGAIPVGMSRVRESPLFSFVPAAGSDVAEVFALLDDVDSWIEDQLPEAMAWMRSGLDVRFDLPFRTLVHMAQEENDFEGFLSYSGYAQDIIDNMDF